MIVYPVSESYVVTHSARGYVPAAELGAPCEDVSFTTSDGLRLEGWYVPTNTFPLARGAAPRGANGLAARSGRSCVHRAGGLHS